MLLSRSYAHVRTLSTLRKCTPSRLFSAEFSPIPIYLVNRDVLIDKLELLGVREHPLDWFKSYLQDRK